MSRGDIMKKLTILLLLILCTGCSNNPVSNNELMKSSTVESSTLSATEKYVENTEPDYNTSSDITFIDLSLPENSSYMEHYEEFSYGNEYTLSDGRKIIEDINLYLVDKNGNKNAVIEIPEEDTQKCAVFCDMIDENRFAYYIINHETIDYSGIYNLETGENHRIKPCEDGSVFIPEKTADNYLYFSKGFISDFRGVGKLNLDTLEFNEIDCSSLLDNEINYLGNPCFSTDGTDIVVYGKITDTSQVNEMNNYQLVIFSLTDNKVVETYEFSSKCNYVNHQIVYHSANEVYLYLFQYGDDPQTHLYIIDLSA